MTDMDEKARVTLGCQMWPESTTLTTPDTCPSCLHPGGGGGKIAIADSPPVHNAHASQKQMPEMTVFG